jgi:hypothetical protein
VQSCQKIFPLGNDRNFGDLVDAGTFLTEGKKKK